MTDIYKKKLSLVVAWFNILVSVAFPIGNCVVNCVEYHERPRYFYADLPRVIIMTVSLIIWLVASIVLVKGIKENRPKLMAIWISLGYLLAIIILGIVIYMGFTIKMWTGSLRLALEETFVMTLGLVILILCIIPVRKLYQRMSIPAPVQPTEIVMASEKPMEVGPSYMPVFEDV